MSNKEKMTNLRLMRRNRRTSDNGTNMVDALRKNNEKNYKDVEGEGEHIENEKLEEEEEKEENDQRFMLNKEKMKNKVVPTLMELNEHLDEMKIKVWCYRNETRTICLE